MRIASLTLFWIAPCHLDAEISAHTVKFHVNAILAELDVHSRTEAVVKSRQLSWGDPPGA